MVVCLSADRACLVHVVRTELRVIRVLIIYCIGYTDYTLSYNNATFLSGTEFPVLVPGTTLTDGLNSFVFRATGVDDNIHSLEGFFDNRRTGQDVWKLTKKPWVFSFEKSGFIYLPCFRSFGNLD